LIATKEAQLFAENHVTDRSIGLAFIRDCNGARRFETLLRRRGGTLAELWCALRALKPLQAEQAPAATPRLPEPHATPIEPESRSNPSDCPPQTIARMAPRSTRLEPPPGRWPAPANRQRAFHRSNPTGASRQPRRRHPSERCGRAAEAALSSGVRRSQHGEILLS
jgi:hypothetical protein